MIKFVAVDIESIGLKPYGGVIWMLAFTKNGKTRVIHDCFGLKKLPSDIERDLKDDTICKIIHSSQMDVPYIELNLGFKIRNVWDTELCETCIQGVRLNIKQPKGGVDPNSYHGKLLRLHGTALEYVLPRYKFPKPDKSTRLNFIDRPMGRKFTPKEISYAGGDTKYLPQIQKAQEYLLTRDKQLEVALLENKVSERYHDMKVRGIGFDPVFWRANAIQNNKEFYDRISKLPRDVNNWNSEKQVKAYFRTQGIHIPTYDDLDKIYLQTRNKILGDFIATRELSKSVSSYGLSWFNENYIDKDGRIRCDITQIINTGRNSMSSPNLQQLPGNGNNDPLRLKVLRMILKEEKKLPQHRRAFIPKKGHVFVIGDFSGQEIGIMAAASDEKLWIDALLRGEDVHALTASIIDPSSWSAAKERGCTFPKKCKCKGHKQLREPAKINNFMLAYGGGPQRFADYTGTDLITAAQYVGAHKRVIPRLTAYLARNGRDAIASGVSYSADPYQRRRVLTGEEDWQVRNQGMNNPIQAAGANMLKLAMASLPWEFPIVLVIHDEIICEVPKSQANKCVKALRSVMEKSADYITGIKGLIKAEPRVAMNLMKA